MDIKHLQYFIEIVNSKFNISQASRKLMVSQPALSQIIKNFEVRENIQLFERYGGRLLGLTPSGKILYKNALILAGNYSNMLEELRKANIVLKGKIRIGIPPLILGTIFSHIIPAMILDYPDIEFEITEAGAFELRSALLAKSLDLAVLLESEHDSHIINQYPLLQSELTAFMSADNPLTSRKKLHWANLNNQPMVILDNTFIVHHQLIEKFAAQKVNPKITIMSANWDFLLMSTRKTDFITILPSATANIFLMDGVAEVPFHDPIIWKAAICQIKKERYSQVEKHVLQTIINGLPRPNTAF